MNCSKCGYELSEGANFCSKCGFNVKNGKPVDKKKETISPAVNYGGYLAVGGWLTVIAGTIVAIYLISKSNTGYRGLDDRVVLTGIVVFISSVIYAWLYFGLNNAILKITRIEEALGIGTFQEVKKVENIKEDISISDKKVQKNGVNDPDDLPWELREKSDQK